MKESTRPPSKQDSVPKAPPEPPREQHHVVRYERNVGRNRQYTTILLYVLLGMASAVVCIYFLINHDQLTKILDTLGGIAAPILIGIALAYILHPLVVLFEEHVFASAARHKYNRARRRLLKTKLAFDQIRLTASASEDSISAAKEKLTAAGKALAESKAALAAEAEQKRIAAALKQSKRKTKPSFHKKSGSSRARTTHPYRVPALICTYLILFLLLSVFAWIVIPQCVAGLTNFVRLIRHYSETLPSQLQNIRLPDAMSGIISSEEFSKQLLNFFTYAFNVLSEFLVGLLTKLPTIIGSTISGVTNLLLGVFLSIYFLSSKEMLLSQLSRASDAVFGKKIHKALCHVVRRTHQTFGAFIRGKLIDSLLMTVVCIILFSIAGIPYAALITLITVITNLIPYFGPFIGAIPSGIIILLAEPPKLILFILLIIVIQQIEGNILEPRILGHTMGLAPVWIMVAILIMGELFGLVGMVLGVPIFSVLYSLFADFCRKRLKKRNAPKQVSKNTK